MRRTLLALLLSSFLTFPAHAQSLTSFDITPTGPTDRVIFIAGTIDQTLAATTITELKRLDKASPGETITVHIMSPGGSVYDGLAIYDAIESLRSPVTTVCDGYCMSMGAFLLAIGDHREAGPNATIMLHQIATGSEVQKLDSLRVQLNETQRLQDIMNQILSTHTGLSIDDLNALESRDNFMSPSTAKAKGLIDEILYPTRNDARIKG